MKAFFLVGGLISVAIIGKMMNHKNENVPQHVQKSLQTSGIEAPAKMQDVPKAVEKAMQGNMDAYQKRLDAMGDQ